MKLNNNIDYRYFLSLIVISLFAAFSLFFIIYFTSDSGAGTEFSDINDEITFDKNQLYKTKIYYSPFNPRPILEENIPYPSKNIKNLIPDKRYLLSNLDIIKYFNLKEKEKEQLFLDLIYYVSNNFLSKEDIFSSIVPSYKIILSFLYTDTFAKSIIVKSYNNYNASLFYQDFLYLRKIYYPYRNTILELFDNYFYKFLDNSINYKSTANILKKSDFFYPKTKELKYNHRYALDIFFKKIKKINEDEIGPAIYSFTSGIVVVSENNWQGGTTLESYKGGGISPKSGNGVIVYDPIKKRFILYFHLYKTMVKPGDIIKAGVLLGFGGNSGSNARKRGHGKHLHLEIYDISKYRFLNCYEIRDLIF